MPKDQLETLERNHFQQFLAFCIISSIFQNFFHFVEYLAFTRISTQHIVEYFLEYLEFLAISRICILFLFLVFTRISYPRLHMQLPDVVTTWNCSVVPNIASLCTGNKLPSPDIAQHQKCPKNPVVSQRQGPNMIGGDYLGQCV